MARRFWTSNLAFRNLMKEKQQKSDGAQAISKESQEPAPMPDLQMWKNLHKKLFEHKEIFELIFEKQIPYS